jgi:hypothetical protein
LRWAPGLIAWSLVGPASAAPIVDQQFHGDGQTYAPIGGELQRAQTFTAGIAGQLTSFEVTIADSDFDPDDADLTWAVFRTQGGVPEEAPIAEGRVAVALEFAAELFSVDVSGSAIQVSPGDVLAFGIGNSASRLGDQAWFLFGTHASEGATYPLGAPFLRVTDGSSPGFETWTRDGTDLDWHFTTRVDPAIVPEPASALLVGTGLWRIAARRLRGNQRRGPAKPG